MRAYKATVSSSRSQCRKAKARTGADTISLIWHAWDAHHLSWSGPNVANIARAGAEALTRELEDSPGGSWFGPIVCSVPGEPKHRMFALIHDVQDCGIAMLYCGESKVGPAEIVVVVPAARRGHLRTDFAFELLAFAKFLLAVPDGAEMAIHDGISAALSETDASESLVFSLSTGLWPRDCELALSRCTETIAVASMDWLTRRQ